MRLFKCVVLCLFAIAFVFVQANADVVNLVPTNSGFESDDVLEGWTTGLSGDAVATHGIDEDSIYGAKAAYIDTTNATGTNWHVGLTQNLEPLEANMTYTLDFWAKGNFEREISIEVKRTPGGGLPYEGVTSQAYTITDQWTEYFKTFTPSKSYPDENGQTAQVAFWVGQVEGEVWLDSVRVYAGEKQEALASVEAGGKLVTTWANIKFSR